MAGLRLGSGEPCQCGSGCGTQLRGRDGQGALREWETHGHQILWEPPGSRPPVQRVHPAPWSWWPPRHSDHPLMMQENGLWIKRSEVKPWHPFSRGAPRRTLPYQSRSEVPLEHMCCKSSEKSLGVSPRRGSHPWARGRTQGRCPLPPRPIPLQRPPAEGTAESGEPGRLAWFLSGDTSGADVSKMKCSS